MEGRRMHELAAVREVIDAARAGIAEDEPCRVDTVSIRRSSSFPEEALLRGFELLAAGTVLEGARLEIEVVSRFVECACGRAWVVAAADLTEYGWVCPVCGHVEEIDARDDLALLQVTVTRLEAVVVAGAGSR
jgi:Zn finger protein HypA/HybF involved in hydrogenase expression